MRTMIKSTIPPIIFLALGMLFFMLIGSTIAPFTSNRFVLGLIAVIGLYLLSLLFTRNEGVSMETINLVPDRRTFIKLIAGLLIGLFIAGTMLALLLNFTHVNIERIENVGMMPFMIAATVFIPLALMEELLFRGYPLFRLTENLNVRTVILITAVLFALYHFDGTQDIVTLLLGPGIWGVTFAVAAYLSNSLAVPLGIHISANVLLACLGFKPKYISMWNVSVDSIEVTNSINPDQLGIFMQLGLLVASIIALEIHLRRA